VANFSNEGDDDGSGFDDPEDSQLVKDAKKEIPESVEYSYTERDVALYNLGIGATEKELQWTFEGHEEFSALPTFGVIPQFSASSGLPLDFLPNFNPVRFPSYLVDLRADYSLPHTGQVITWRTISVH
jgi:multifunctional beta-oxidation protein